MRRRSSAMLSISVLSLLNGAAAADAAAFEESCHENSVALQHSTASLSALTATGEHDTVHAAAPADDVPMVGDVGPIAPMSFGQPPTSLGQPPPQHFLVQDASGLNSSSAGEARAAQAAEDASGAVIKTRSMHGVATLEVGFPHEAFVQEPAHEALVQESAGMKLELNSSLRTEGQLALGTGLAKVSLRRHEGRQRMKSGAITKKTSYFGAVQVGTPMQEFVVVYDTGSGNLVLPGKMCNDAACKKHRQYDPAASSTSSAVSCDGHGGPANDIVTIVFGTGDISGKCFKDNVCLSTAACAKVDFIAAQHESYNPFGLFHFDGVQGLGTLPMAQGPSFSLIHGLGPLLTQPVFSVFLSADDAEESRLMFGHVPPDMMASQMYWEPLSRGGSSGYWEVMLHDISIAGNLTGLCEGCFAAVDTGTSDIAGPHAFIEALNAKVRLKSDCSNLDSLPTVGFVIGSNPKRVYNLHPQDYVTKTRTTLPLLGTTETCLSAFMPLDVPPPKGPLVVLGIPFLTRFVTAYDSQSSRVGFAVAKHHIDGSAPGEVIALLSS